MNFAINEITIQYNVTNGDIQIVVFTLHCFYRLSIYFYIYLDIHHQSIHPSNHSSILQTSSHLLVCLSIHDPSKHPPVNTSNLPISNLTIRPNMQSSIHENLYLLSLEQRPTHALSSLYLICFR